MASSWEASWLDGKSFAIEVSVVLCCDSCERNVITVKQCPARLTDHQMAGNPQIAFGAMRLGASIDSCAYWRWIRWEGSPMSVMSRRSRGDGRRVGGRQVGVRHVLVVRPDFLCNARRCGGLLRPAGIAARWRGGASRSLSVAFPVVGVHGRASLPRSRGRLLPGVSGQVRGAVLHYLGFPAGPCEVVHVS